MVVINNFTFYIKSKEMWVHLNNFIDRPSKIKWSNVMQAVKLFTIDIISAIRKTLHFLIFELVY